MLFYSAASGYIVTNQQRYIAPKQVQTIQDLDLMVGVIDADNINQNGIWSVTPSNTDCLSYNSSTGTITGIKSTTTGVTVTCTRSISGVTCSESYTANITEIANGTYFMKNKKTSRYVDIDGPYMQAGTTVHQWDFNANYSQRWIFTHIGDGYYTIESANDQTAYYLGVQNDGTATDTPVVLRTGSITDGMKWRVSFTDSGAFKITPKTGEQNGRVLSVASYLVNGNGVTIQQRDYVNDGNYKDEWFIDDKLISLCAVPAGAFHNHEMAFENVRYSFYGSFFPNVLKSTSNLTVDEAINMMQQADILTIKSHGDAEIDDFGSVLGTYVYLKENSPNEVKLYSNAINGITSNDVLPTSNTHDCFSNLKLALFVACRTAAGAENNVHNNLPAKMVEEGVTTAIGFYDEIVCPQGTNWMEYFYDAFLNGASVVESIEFAKICINHQNIAYSGMDNYDYYKLNSIKCYGDDSLCVDDIRG